MKNALDVGSRPEEESVFKGKPAAVASVTPYALGAFGANHALRQTFVFLDIPVMQQPEAYIAKAANLFADDGEVKDGSTAKLLDNVMSSFARFAATIRGGGAPDDDHRLAALLDERREVARDYVNSDAKTLSAIAAKHDPATFFHPKGELVQGARAVEARYTSDAAQFRPGGTTKLEIVQSGASGDLAFWTGYQRAEARMADGKSVPMTLRITEVFRREDGAYKLVHRHADIPASPPSPGGRVEK